MKTGRKVGQEGERSVYLSQRLLIRNRVHSLRSLVSAFEFEGDELRAEGLDHELVVVEGGDDRVRGDARGEWGGYVGGGHFEWVGLVGWVGGLLGG